MPLTNEQAAVVYGVTLAEIEAAEASADRAPLVPLREGIHLVMKRRNPDAKDTHARRDDCGAADLL
jgi:hypothetical protein